MTLNINGLATDAATKILGVKIQRLATAALRASLNRNDIHGQGQGHHYKARGNDRGAMQRAHDRVEHQQDAGPEVVGDGGWGTSPSHRSQLSWSCGNTPDGPCARPIPRMRAHLYANSKMKRGESGQWCQHTSTPGPRRKQRARLVAALQETEATNVVLLVDHNSVLHETLDSVTPTTGRRQERPGRRNRKHTEPCT